MNHLNSEMGKAVAVAMAEALMRDENWDNGSINWNFIDADCYYKVLANERHAERVNAYYDCFNTLSLAVEPMTCH